jgi:geranylgeranyl pyrophosphate synthase
MSKQERLMPKANAILKEHGLAALKLAQRTISQEKVGFEPLRKTLDYFMGEVWLDLLHPALLSLSSEAIGGNSQDSVQVGAAFVLLAGGADIHDDIIDQSETKEGKQTVFGKFGKDLAILAGDALLFQGLYLLHEAVETLPEDKRHGILDAVKAAFWGISGAEAKEASYRGLTELSGPEYFGIIRNKVAVAEATARVGAILGGGTPKEVELLSEYGETFGILNTVRDEYIDVFDPQELKSRAEKECLPLPMLFAFKDLNKKKAILELLKQPLNEKTMEKILDLTMDSKETRMLTEELKTLMNQENQQIVNLKRSQKDLELLLKASLEDL